MAHVALTPTAFASETLETAKHGLLPAAGGAVGAALGLAALTTFLAPASVPLSVLGLVLGRRSGDWLAVALGTLGIVLALRALLASDGFWLLFAGIFGGLAA
ncbi:MAG: hypothetical protein ACE5DS_04695 [Kiloniellaceae bacterium]